MNKKGNNMKKFDYKSVYKKYRSGDKVKITFMDAKVPVTETVRIISINDKKISFEDKENVYECTSTEIVNIKKTLLDKILHNFFDCCIE